MIKKTILIFFLSIITITAQQFNRAQLDSLYNLYTYLRGVNTSASIQKEIETDPAYQKCGFGLAGEIKANISSFSIEQQNVLLKILQRPALPLSIVSPDGFFRIHYTDTGTDAIGYDINLFAQALDSSYNFEVNYLGYPPPPTDGTEGGDGKYDIYVRNLINYYGQTTSETKVGATSWTSYIEVDNDFGTGFYTHGIDAARVTVAHEFHHAIQIGNYALLNSSSAIRFDDLFFYEITSTSMEEFVFNTIDDYYNYMRDYFQNPERPFPLNNGYNLAIWNIFMKDIFDYDIIKKQWELMPTKRALEAINQSIFERDSNFGNELNTFGIWTYFTNSRSIPGLYFKEATNYPLITPTSSTNFIGSTQYDMTVGPTANYFFEVNLPSSDGIFYSIITNSDFIKADINPSQMLDFSLSIFDDGTGSKVLNNKYSITFNRDNQTFWNNAGILNNILVYGDSNTTIPDIENEIFAYPLPYRYSQDYGRGIAISFETNSTSDEIYFNVYSTSLNLMYADKISGLRHFTKNPKNYSEFYWNALDKDKNKLASGVYVFFIKIDSEIKKGKLVIFND